MNKESGFGLIESFLVLLILAVVGFGGYTVWHNHHKTKPVSTTQSTKTAVKTTNPASSSDYQSCQADTQAPCKVPELGIQFDAPSSLAGLIYHASTDAKGVNVSTKSISALDKNCTATDVHGALGGIRKSSTYPDTTASPPVVVKQVSNFYIAYYVPQQSCTTDANTADKIDLDVQTLKSALNSARAIQ